MLARNCDDASEARPSHIHRLAMLFACFLGILAGCAAPGNPLIESPLSVDQQQQAVLEIAPRGTLRDDARRRLKAAGIEFESGGNGSILYLTLWKRPNGERWHIDVALLFDSAGKLYQTRAADSKISLGPADEFADPQLRAPSAAASGLSPHGINPANATGEADDGPERVAFPGQNGNVRSGAH